MIDFSEVISDSEIDNFSSSVVSSWSHGSKAVIIGQDKELGDLAEESSFVLGSINFKDDSVCPDFISLCKDKLLINKSIITESSVFNKMNFLELIFFVSEFFVVNTP